MTEKEIKQQVIENLEKLLENARKGERLRLVASLKSDDELSAAAVCSTEEAATLLLGWVRGERDMLVAMNAAMGVAMQMVAEGRFNDDAQ